MYDITIVIFGKNITSTCMNSSERGRLGWNDLFQNISLSLFHEARGASHVMKAGLIDNSELKKFDRESFLSSFKILSYSSCTSKERRPLSSIPIFLQRSTPQHRHLSAEPDATKKKPGAQFQPLQFSVIAISPGITSPSAMRSRGNGSSAHVGTHCAWFSSKTSTSSAPPWLLPSSLPFA